MKVLKVPRNSAVAQRLNKALWDGNTVKGTVQRAC